MYRNISQLYEVEVSVAVLLMTIYVNRVLADQEVYLRSSYLPSMPKGDAEFL